MKRTIKYAVWLAVCGWLAAGCGESGEDGVRNVSGIRASVEASAAEYAGDAGHVRLYLTDENSVISKSYSFNNLTEFNDAVLNLPLKAFRAVLFANLDPDVFEVPAVGEKADAAGCGIRAGAVVEKPLLSASADISGTASGVTLELKNAMARLTFGYPSPAEGTFVLRVGSPETGGGAELYEVVFEEEFAAGAPDFSVSCYLYPVVRGDVSITGAVGESAFSFMPDRPEERYEAGHDYLFTVHSEPLGRSAASSVPRYVITLNR